MKTLLVDAGRMFDPDTLSLTREESKRDAISRIYIVPEDCIVKYDDIEKNAKAGDIVIIFYEDKYPNRMIVVSSDEWKENIAVYDTEMQKRKEEWALKQSCGDCCNCKCESC